MPALFKGSGVIYTTKNILYDQLIGAPIFTSMFFTFLDLSNGKTVEQSMVDLKKKLLPTLIVNWKIWPALMAINFSIVPVPYRVLYANITGMFWSVYLSSAQNTN